MCVDVESSQGNAYRSYLALTGQALMKSKYELSMTVKFKTLTPKGQNQLASAFKGCPHNRIEVGIVGFVSLGLRELYSVIPEGYSTKFCTGILKFLRWSDTRGHVAGTCRSDM